MTNNKESNYRTIWYSLLHPDKKPLRDTSEYALLYSLKYSDNRKNIAILNIKHKSELIQWACKQVLNNER